LVTGAGVVGGEQVLGTGGGGLDGAAFGAGVYLAAWVDSSTGEVLARIVTPAGTLGPVLRVDTDPTPSNDVSVGFDGSGFLVAWGEEVGGAGSGNWQIRARRVSGTGATVGATFEVSTQGQRAQRSPFLASDGERWLVTWTETLNDTDEDGLCDGDEASCWDVEGRFLALDGKPWGPDFSIAFTAGNQFLSPVASAGGDFLVAWTGGDAIGGLTGDVYGQRIDPAVPQPPAAYCTAQVNSAGCTPLIVWSGTPSATAPTPFDITAVNVLNNKNGLLFYGVSGPLFAPFAGGTKCAAPPTRRTGVQDSGGTPVGLDCSGVFEIDFNVPIQNGVDPALVPGQAVYAQYWSRDPASPSTTNLTNALQLMIWP
jgi:hypothetical protein